jgi:hypothetical protein
MMLNFQPLQTLQLKSINILLLICCSTFVFAQNDSSSTKIDSLEKKSYKPTGIRIGTDALSIARNFYSKTFNGWEVNADVDFDRFFLAVDYGHWARTYGGDNGDYDNSGNYFRAGIDVNFLTKDPEQNMFFIGGRYGQSTFSEHMKIEGVEDEIWGSLDKELYNTNVKGRWFELTTGLRVKMWKYIWMGYTARFKFGLSTNETGEMVPSDVPGYGRTDRESTWGFNYQIFFRIPVRKTPVPAATKK